jgi:SAM-dependent methyltransferase
MYEKVDHCPACSGTEFTNKIICDDHTVTGESFAIVSCNECKLWITSPRPNHKNLGKYYDSDAYISHSNKGNSLVNVIYKMVRTYTMHQKTQLIKKFLPTGKLIDYGCGTGDFLAACKGKGYDVIGIEPNDVARQQAIEQTKSNIYPDIDGLNRNQKVDIITMWHVLEHVPDPKETLKRLRKQLNTGGHIIIAVPNRDSLDASQYKEHWAAYDVPRHLFHFNKLNIKYLSKKLKLDYIKSIPQYFDAYYVSMLSEKYLKNSSSFINGVIKGFQSNQWASKNNNNYSSLIYVLRKK